MQEIVKKEQTEIIINRDKKDRNFYATYSRNSI